MSNNNDAAIALLEKHFDIAFTAPDGIKKLRELILSLAMQGKLVPQDPRDQPASELLKDIEAEKKSLVKEGKIKKSKPLPEIKPDELPYEVPKSWNWSRLGEIVSLLGDGIHGTPIYDENGDYFFINGNNLSDGIIEIKENTKKVSINEYQKYKKELNYRTVLVSINGTIGNVAFYNNEKVILGKSACYFNLFEQIDKEFTKRLLNSKYFLEFAFASATGSTIKNVSLKAMREFAFPIPPLAEQRRIVAKIDELMARCDELEKLRGDRDRKQITVHTAALNRLLIAKEQSNFNTAWQFITQHFGELYSVKENVTELRKAILQLAVMGKLVPQDPNDQPASELLREIEQEKEKLIKEGKIKKSKPLPEIKPDEIPYNLPKGWEWVRLGEIAIFENGDRSNRYPNENDHQASGIPFFGAKDMVDGILRFDNGLRFISEDKFLELSNGKLMDKDFVVLLRGTVGKIAIFRNNAEFSTGFINAQMLIVRMINKKLCDLFRLYSSSTFFQSLIANKTTGSAVRQMPANVVLNFLTPLPPLAEQQRIVAKIDQLMALCDNLEKQIDTANSKQANLLNAVMTKI